MELNFRLVPIQQSLTFNTGLPNFTQKKGKNQIYLQLLCSKIGKSYYVISNTEFSNLKNEVLKICISKTFLSQKQ